MKKNILMIGDSITEAFDARLLDRYFNVNNQGVSGDSTVETSNRIEEGWFSPRPDYVFLCIGTNDLARRRDPDTILRNILDITERIKYYQTSARIVLTSLFPTRSNPLRPNITIREINNLLEKLAEDINAGYFDLFPYFIDQTGDLKEDYTEDGLHLTHKAYLDWAEILINRFAEK